ncbi:MAG: hypothetical protein DRJ67_01260 [Thermoprotei archaeon]|nr:MAG: hypothetical protein DRJ67_01260 [Thermoprotei archaeon]
MRLLVVGYLEVDSGKTSLALSLVRALKARRRLVLAAKPVAGHSAWHQYQTVINSRRLGLLVGEDAYRLAEEVGTLDRVQLLNPVDVLIAPMDPAKAGGLVEEPLNIALMRVTSCAEGLKVAHFLCEDVIKRAPLLLAHELMEVARSLRPAPRKLSLSEAREILEREAGARADECLELLERECEDLVVESFNNAAAPTPRSLEADYVLAVAPGRIDLFEGSEYKEAVSVLTSLGMLTKLTVGEVSKYLKPLHTVWVRPVAESFEEAYREPVEKLLRRIL